MKLISIGSYLSDISNKIIDTVYNFEFETNKKACMFMSEDTFDCLPIPRIEPTTEDFDYALIDEFGFCSEYGEDDETMIFFDDELEFGEIIVKEYSDIYKEQRLNNGSKI